MNRSPLSVQRSTLFRYINGQKEGGLTAEFTVATAMRSIVMTFALRGTHLPTSSRSWAIILTKERDELQILVAVSHARIPGFWGGK